MEKQFNLYDFKFINIIFDFMTQKIIPELQDTVALNNKVFAAMIIEKKNLELVMSGTNLETINPLYHGEISCLNNYWGIKEKKRIQPQDCYFISTHEPCSLCLSAITWSGFDNFFYLFKYEDTKNQFSIPHDIKILEEVFDCKEGEYNRNNDFWQSHDIKKLMSHCEKNERDILLEKMKIIEKEFVLLSELYQSHKSNTNIPLN